MPGATRTCLGRASALPVCLVSGPSTSKYGDDGCATVSCRGTWSMLRNETSISTASNGAYCRNSSVAGKGWNTATSCAPTDVDVWNVWSEMFCSATMRGGA